MNKQEIIKELEELRDIKNYSQSELLNTGYRTAILDALDLVKKLTIPAVVGQSEQLVCHHCKDLGVYVDEYGGKPCKCTNKAN